MDTSFINIKMLKRGTKICAFCKHWFDPTCSAIEPVRPSIGLWHYDNTAVKRCGMDGMLHKSFGSCRNFENKV